MEFTLDHSDMLGTNLVITQYSSPINHFYTVLTVLCSYYQLKMFY